jgi:hypothetical protein
LRALPFSAVSRYDCDNIFWRFAVVLCRRGWFLLFIAILPTTAVARKQKPCLSIDEATTLVNKDLCITAHVYDVVRLPDGTRFLDVCSPQTPDAECRFTVVSLPEDRKDVGELSQYNDKNVQIRGIVQPMRGRAGMLLSHARQFNGGPPKFRPNPLLLSGFNADQSRPPVPDPNLRPQGRSRAFMNPRDQETR